MEMMVVGDKFQAYLACYEFRLHFHIIMQEHIFGIEATTK